MEAEPLYMENVSVSCYESSMFIRGGKSTSARSKGRLVGISRSVLPMARWLLLIGAEVNLPCQERSAADADTSRETCGARSTSAAAPGGYIQHGRGVDTLTTPLCSHSTSSTALRHI